MMSNVRRFARRERDTTARRGPKHPGSQHRRLRWAAAHVSAAALAAAVLIPAAASAEAAKPTGPRIPVLAWHSCDGGFKCATARVPLDYRHPRGNTVSVAVIRHLATDKAHALGSLFVNSGGPSEQIESFVASYPAIPAQLRASYNIMTFDPRGFGFSTAIRCFSSMAAENKFLSALPPFPVGTKQDSVWEQTYAKFDARCAKRGGSLLDHDSTADVSRDMNLLRQAVGDPVLNYVGLSYGTGLGAVYANLFPGKVGHMVLDGNLDPVSWVSGGKLPSGMRRGADLATAATMRAFLDLCGKSSTAACAFSAGSAAATTAKWHTLLDRLRAHPVKVGRPPQTFTYADTITDVPLGTVSQWQAGAGLLQELWIASAPGGSHAAPHANTVLAATSRAGLHGVYSGIEQSFGVLCADSADPHQVSDYAAAARLGLHRAGGFGLFWAWNEEACAQWPRGASQDGYTGPWNRRTASPILVIGVTHDPATPYQDSVNMSRDLARARLLTVDGYGHTEFANPSTCATIDEIRYLTTGALPAAGAVCQQNGTPFPTPSSRNR
jgi:pimeloyl-ACP methyl ester carboxylesterase